MPKILKRVGSILNGYVMLRNMTGRAKSDMGSGRIRKGFVVFNVLTMNSNKPTYTELKKALETQGINPDGICNPDWWSWE